MGYGESSDCHSASAPHAKGRVEANALRPFFGGTEDPPPMFYRAQTERLSRIAAELGVAPDRIAVVLQEVWLDALEHQKDFRGEDADRRLSSWLGVVVRSKSTNLLRRLRRVRAEALSDLPAELVDDEAKDPSEVMEAAERAESVASALEELRKKDPLNYRLVCGRFLEGRSIADLAAETGLGINAISCRLRRTLAKLGVQLHAWRPDAGTAKRPVSKARRRKR